MFKLNLDMELFFLPPMVDNGRGICLTRTFELPFPPTANVLLSGVALNGTPVPLGYVLSLTAVSTLIIGCTTPAEVDENAQIARQFTEFTTEQMQELEDRTRPNAEEFSYFKRPASIFSRS